MNQLDQNPPITREEAVAILKDYILLKERLGPCVSLKNYQDKDAPTIQRLDHLIAQGLHNDLTLLKEAGLTRRDQDGIPIFFMNFLSKVSLEVVKQNGKRIIKEARANR